MPGSVISAPASVPAPAPAPVTASVPKPPRRRLSVLLLLTVLATLSAALFSAPAALAAGAPPHALRATVASMAAPDNAPAFAPCTSKDPVVCRIREMTPEEREQAREVRIQYHHLLDRMRQVADGMRAEGASDEDIARVMVDMRNDAKDITRAGMSPEAIRLLEERNMKKYGNPLGPTADQLYAKYGSWQAVIEASTRTSPEVDRELGLEPHN
ncbi:hypothetical protein ACFU76_11400 [Streptomyces sp. NPDC057539]|uniref:hypothetical protein n=1 Tax=Streptomyces sp. NPDC057539 TaxID=3346159 RepID=UPI0036B2135A